MNKNIQPVDASDNQEESKRPVSSANEKGASTHDRHILLPPPPKNLLSIRPEGKKREVHEGAINSVLRDLEIFPLRIPPPTRPDIHPDNIMPPNSEFYIGGSQMPMKIIVPMGPSNHLTQQYNTQLQMPYTGAPPMAAPNQYQFPGSYLQSSANFAHLQNVHYFYQHPNFRPWNQ